MKKNSSIKTNKIEKHWNLLREHYWLFFKNYSVTMCTTITVFDGELTNNNHFNGDLSKWDTSSVTDMSYSKYSQSWFIYWRITKELHVETNVILFTILFQVILKAFLSKSRNKIYLFSIPLPILGCFIFVIFCFERFSHIHSFPKFAVHIWYLSTFDYSFLN